MTTGLGLALLGIWLLPFAAMISKSVTANGIWLSLIVAVTMTVYLTRF